MPVAMLFLLLCFELVVLGYKVKVKVFLSQVQNVTGKKQ